MEAVGVAYLASASGEWHWLAVAPRGQCGGMLPPGPARHQEIVSEAITASGVGPSWVAALRHRHEPYVRPEFWSLEGTPEAHDASQRMAFTAAGRAAVRAKNRLTAGDARSGYEAYEADANVGDPTVVTTCGIEASDGLGWAWINGSGVVGRGVGPTGSAIEAEVLAITQALQFYPHRSPVTVLSGSGQAVDMFAALAAGRKINFRIPNWLFQRARQARKHNLAARIEQVVPSPDVPSLGLVTEHAREACRRRGDVRVVERPESRRPAVLRRR